MSFDPVIRVAGLSKRYPARTQPYQRLVDTLFRRQGRGADDFAALKDIDFAVAAGETVGIVGRNGSGKSTLLQIICGTLTPTTGVATVRGRVAALLELGAGFNPEFTGIENVRLNASLLGLRPDEIESRLERILAFADIGDFVHRPVKTYSSGMFVRLAFAVVANVDADVLIVDEALAVGDAFFTQKCMRYLKSFRDQGGTLLFVSHDAGSVVGLCDRALWLDRGQLRALGDAKTVVQQYLASQYDTDVIEPVLPQPDEPQLASASIGGELLVLDGVAGFGEGGAQLTGVALLGADGQPLGLVLGGESVRIRLEARVFKPMLQPVFGFYIKDKLGQILFGESSATHIDAQLSQVLPGQDIHAEFLFQMPHLKAGDYVVTAAIAEGTQAEHRMHHWVHDALAFSSRTRVLHGLLGFPMRVNAGVSLGSAVNLGAMPNREEA